MSTQINSGPFQASIPHELQEAIIDVIHYELFPNDKEYNSLRRRALGICSLVSSKWFKRARHLLFLGFCLLIPGFDHDGPGGMLGLLELLQSPLSTLSPFIREVGIRGSDNIYIENDDICDQGERLNTCIVAVLPFMRHVQRLSMKFVRLADLSEHSKRIIQRLTTVTTFTLESDVGTSVMPVTDLLSVSSWFPNLQSLEVTYVELAEDSKGVLPQTSVAFPHLHTLRIKGYLKGLEPLLSKKALFTLPTVRTLDLLIQGALYPETLSFINAMGANLQHLIFNAAVALSARQPSNFEIQQSYKFAEGSSVGH
ncbi:hypothetical protein H0H87_003724 [Tephrocybe sp. NHM501043]|nr:hypothetical protein H0H87_003724 [Tephrocybe sp. NHM501043]